MSLLIVDYGVGNLLSVVRAVEHCGGSAYISAEPILQPNTKGIIFPGVGTFGAAMSHLKDPAWQTLIHEVKAKKIPILGICLGMQLFAEKSDEFGNNEGLGLIPGKVEKLKAGNNVKIPHMGWNPVNLIGNHPILKDVQQDGDFYFSHSYFFAPKNDRHTQAKAIHGDNAICAIIADDNIIGVQFHPEKSARLGLKIIENFMNLC
jgi:glutamine amidotransferase